MTWTKHDFDRLRKNRAMYLDWIDAIEGGNPIGTETEDGRQVDRSSQDLAGYKERVLEIEGILSKHGEPLDA